MSALKKSKMNCIFGCIGPLQNKKLFHANKRKKNSFVSLECTLSFFCLLYVTSLSVQID